MKGKGYPEKLLTTTVKKTDPHLMIEFRLEQAVGRKKEERKIRSLIAHQECLSYQNKERLAYY